MILRIGDVKIARGIESDTPRIAEPARLRARTADDFNRLIIRIKDLDAAVPKLADILPSGCIHTDVVRITHFAFSRAGFAVGTNELTIA